MRPFQVQNPRDASVTQKVCCCSLRIVVILCAIVFFYHLRNLLVNITNQLEQQEARSISNFARIQRNERRLRGIEMYLNKMQDGNKTAKHGGNVPSKGDAAKKEIFDAIHKYYSEDRTGQADYALEPAGGRILSVRDTESYAQPKTYLGSYVCDESHGAREMINPGMMPGQCWSFKGSKGAAVILLTAKIKITSVSLEHIPIAISHVGDLKSAPQRFTIRGLTSVDDNGEHLGDFTYDIEGPTLQFFEVKSSKPFEMIEFKVTSNHGNTHLTCVYRLRVHGVLEH